MKVFLKKIWWFVSHPLLLAGLFLAFSAISLAIHDGKGALYLLVALAHFNLYFEHRHRMFLSGLVDEYQNMVGEAIELLERAGKENRALKQRIQPAERFQ